MKSILFFGWSFYPTVGATEDVMLNQASELLRRGYKVSVVTSVLADKKETESEAFGITVFRRRYVDPAASFEALEVSIDMTDILKKVQPDVVHFHNGSYLPGGQQKAVGVDTIKTLFNASKRYGVSVVEQSHDIQLKGTEETRVVRELPWDYLVCVSGFVREKWEKLGTNAKKVSVVYDGIDVSKFENATPAPAMLEAAKNGAVVLFCPAPLAVGGSLNAQKNISLVLDALALLKKKSLDNFVLVAFASDAQEKSTTTGTDAVSKRGLETYVTLVPGIDPDEMASYYAGADVMVMPAVNETFGLAFMEAMASSKPVIASNTGGPQQYIHNGENGFFVGDKSPQELADVLESLINDPALRSRVGEQACLTAQDFTVQKMVDGIEHVYEELGLQSLLGDSWLD